MVFDTKTHTYIDNETSKVLISCTELLKKHNLAPKYDSVDSEILRLASERGTLIHKEIEDYIKKGERGFTKELGNFIKEIQYQEIEILESEQLLHNDIVAGTCDFLYKDKDNKVHRADFKTTSTIHKDYVAWQLSLYDHLDTTKANYFEVWHFDKDGYLTIKQLAPKPIKEIEKLLDAERKGEIYQSETMEFQLSSGSVSALDVAVAVTDNSGNSHAAQVTQLGVAVLNSSVACQVASLLFSEGDASGVGSGVDVSSSNVNSDEVCIGVCFLNDGHSFVEQEAGQNDGVVAFGDSLSDGQDASVGGVLSGLVIGVLQTVSGAPLFNAFPASLVEGLVIDGTDVGNQSDLGDHSGICDFALNRGGFGGVCSRSFGGLCLVAATGSQRQNHDQSQQHSQNLLHDFIPP